MSRIQRPFLRRLGAGIALASAFAGAVWLPMPSTPDAGRAGVMREVRTRLPGWHVERVRPTWEGAYSVVSSCGEHEIGFQVVPGHGLPRDDAWLQPSNEYTRERLTRLSDHYRYLIWDDQPRTVSTLSCADELARNRSEASSSNRD